MEHRRREGGTSLIQWTSGSIPMNWTDWEALPAEEVPLALPVRMAARAWAWTLPPAISDGGHRYFIASPMLASRGEASTAERPLAKTSSDKLRVSKVGPWEPPMASSSGVSFLLRPPCLRGLECKLNEKI